MPPLPSEIPSQERLETSPHNQNQQIAPPLPSQSSSQNNHRQIRTTLGLKPSVVIRHPIRTLASTSPKQSPQNPSTINIPLYSRLSTPPKQSQRSPVRKVIDNVELPSPKWGGKLRRLRAATIDLTETPY